jgi:hypothetical protein
VKRIRKSCSLPWVEWVEHVFEILRGREGILYKYYVMSIGSFSFFLYLSIGGWRAVHCMHDCDQR